MFAISRGTALLAPPGLRCGHSYWSGVAAGFDNAERIMKQGMYGFIFNGKLVCIPGMRSVVPSPRIV